MFRLVLRNTAGKKSLNFCSILSCPAPVGVIYLTCPYFCVLVGRVYVSPLPNMAGHYWLSGRVPLGIYSLAERLAKEYFVHDRCCIQDRCDRIHLILLRPATEKPCISQLANCSGHQKPFQCIPQQKHAEPARGDHLCATVCRQVPGKNTRTFCLFSFQLHVGDISKQCLFHW